ncbi:MAG: hypothetical protein IJC21_07635 [Lentisphaeria bacterium]|nr:hypothetical protein [Lentisphaeria bacterium]
MTKRYSDRAPETYLNFLTLKFYLNFILNHNKFIYDNDTFDTLTETFLADNIVERIKNDFSPTMLKRLQQRSRKGDRLDFGDHVTEIIREVWADEKARKKLKELIAEEINARLATFDEDAFVQEGFYSRCQECKELFELSEPEYTILLAIYISEKKPPAQRLRTQRNRANHLYRQVHRSGYRYGRKGDRQQIKAPPLRMHQGQR